MTSHDHEPIVYRFCPSCAGALEARVLKAGEPERLVCTVCGYVFYLDPKVAVGTIIETSPGGIVLVRRAIDPGYGKWVFPGGYVDRGEQVQVAAIREAREECGLDISIERLVNVYSYPGRAPIILVYSAKAMGGTLTIDDESLEVRVFDRDQIPWDELAFRSTHDALRDYLAGLTEVVARSELLQLNPSVFGTQNLAVFVVSRTLLNDDLKLKRAIGAVFVGLGVKLAVSR